VAVFDRVSLRESESAGAHASKALPKHQAGLMIVFVNVANEVGKIVQRFLPEERAVIHWGRSLRTFSISEQNLDGQGLVAPCQYPGRTAQVAWLRMCTGTQL
jgi:hypothetical protein